MTKEEINRTIKVCKAVDCENLWSPSNLDGFHDCLLHSVSMNFQLRGKYPFKVPNDCPYYLEHVVSE